MHFPDTAKSLLQNPHIFNLFNRLIGAKRSTDIFIHSYVKPQPGARVLDVGCGNGRLAPYFRDTRYTGMDISADYIKDAQRAHPWATFICHDACSQELEPAGADLVVICGVLHHLDDAQCRTLLKILARALAPGGMLVDIEGAYTEPQNAIARWLLANDRGNHVRWRSGYEALFAADFTIVECAVRTDLLRIPYTHAIFRAVPKASGS